VRLYVFVVDVADGKGVVNPALANVIHQDDDACAAAALP
jgi:hypothetical protein